MRGDFSILWSITKMILKLLESQNNEVSLFIFLNGIKAITYCCYCILYDVVFLT